MTKALIIDDDKGMCYTLASMVKREGSGASCVHTLKDGLEEALKGEYDIVFLDVQLPDGNGLDFLPKIMEAPTNPEVIIMTALGNPDSAELAITNGAWDYIEKPSSIKGMTLPFLRALQYREEKKAKRPRIALKRDKIIGKSPSINASIELLAQAATSEANVLITGETGTGKELFAATIHENSQRSDKNYIIVDCASLPETLVESTLFGHVKGAFTGADKGTEGLIKHADGGTLLLDEIGELPLSIQKTFLRVLQEKRFVPVGGQTEVTSNFRLIAATNRDLAQMARDGLFRNDLLFRLRSFAMELPPLREHREDIKELSFYYMDKLCESYDIGTKGFSSDLITALIEYNWPGNVRELVNTLERIISVARYEPTLFARHLPNDIRINLAKKKGFKGILSQVAFSDATTDSREFPRLSQVRENAIEQLEQQYLTDLISYTKGNAKDACRTSGIGKSRFYELLKKYNLSLSR